MDRRTVIADAAIGVIADAGLRALTHRRLDETLGLPAGSTSYYFRTKGELLTSVIERITESSRAGFEESIPGTAGVDTAGVTVRYLGHLMSERSSQLRARHALLMDPSIDAEARAGLGRSLFSVERAVELFGDKGIGEGYVALCEGLVIAALSRGGVGVDWRAPIVTYLKGAGKL